MPVESAAGVARWMIVQDDIDRFYGKTLIEIIGIGRDRGPYKATPEEKIDYMMRFPEYRSAAMLIAAIFYGYRPKYPRRKHHGIPEIVC